MFSNGRILTETVSGTMLMHSRTMQVKRWIVTGMVSAIIVMLSLPMPSSSLILMAMAWAIILMHSRIILPRPPTVMAMALVTILMLSHKMPSSSTIQMATELAIIPMPSRTIPVDHWIAMVTAWMMSMTFVQTLFKVLKSMGTVAH